MKSTRTVRCCSCSDYTRSTRPQRTYCAFSSRYLTYGYTTLESVRLLINKHDFVKRQISRNLIIVIELKLRASRTHQLNPTSRWYEKKTTTSRTMTSVTVRIRLMNLPVYDLSCETVSLIRLRESVLKKTARQSDARRCDFRERTSKSNIQGW